MNHIYFLEVGPVSEGIGYEAMLGYVSDDKRERLMKSRSEIDRKILVCADILLRCLLAEHLGRSFEDIRLRKSETGKPYVTGSPRMEFNLSHTRNAVAVALSDKPIGIDIEKIRNMNMKVADHVCSDNELSWIKETGADQTLRFFDIWTKKEAFLKREGTGLTGNMKSLDVLEKMSVFTTYMENGYVISVCADEKSRPANLIRLTEDKLYKIWQESMF